jgi:cation transporter-like permease
MKRFAITLLCALVGYIVAAFASYFLVLQFSSNPHDRAIEAAMTSVFFFGPIVAVIAFIAAFVLCRSRLADTGAETPPQ